jgi:hypothetical protein
MNRCGWILACLVPLIAVGAALAADDHPDVRKAHVAAATDGAVASLLKSIATERIAPDLTVDDLLDRTHSTEDFRKVLARADQIGGPRWIDEQTCQVRLEISGGTVAAALVKIARDHAGDSPIPADVLERHLQGFNLRTFAATGSSTGLLSLNAAPPPPMNPAWSAVPPEVCQRAVASAMQNAVDRVLDSIAPIELAQGKTIADALRVAAIKQSLVDWLTHRPVTTLNYRSDMVVELTLAASPQDLFDVLRVAILSHPDDVPHPADSVQWAEVQALIEHRMATPVGHYTLPQPSSTQRTVEPMRGGSTPRMSQPPDWAGSQVDVTGTSAAGQHSLRAARSAEADALATLHRQVMDLRLAPDLTVGQAAERDTSFARELGRAIDRSAHLYRTEYRPDGSVMVRMSLDMRDIWPVIDGRP